MTPRARRPAKRLAPVLAAALALVVTSCGGGDNDESAEASPTKPAASASDPASSPSTAPTDGGADATSPPETVTDQAQRPAPGDLVNFACTQNAKGAWAAEGDLRNSTKEPMVYSVTVVTVDSGVISGHAAEEVALEPDESTRFELTRIARGSADACMPRVVRAPR